MNKTALIIGGTGVISTAVVAQAQQQNWNLTLLNRGNHPAPEGTKHLIVDINDEKAVAAQMKDLHFDVICDFILFMPKDAQKRISLFQNHCNQYIFISSATVYQKPPENYLMTEDTPLGNPFSLYAQNKIACEDVIRAAGVNSGFPYTIVRPSYTYGPTMVPWVLNARNHRYSFIHRMIKGKPIVVPGDGSSFFTLTYNSDFAYGFVGLMGNPKAYGQAFHITAEPENAMTWDGYLYQIATLLNVTPKIFHLTSEQISSVFTDEQGALLGDKSQTALFGLSKLKSCVPSYHSQVSFSQGISQVLAHYHAHPALMGFDTTWDKQIDSLIQRFSLV